MISTFLGFRVRLVLLSVAMASTGITRSSATQLAKSSSETSQATQHGLIALVTCSPSYLAVRLLQLVILTLLRRTNSWLEAGRPILMVNALLVFQKAKSLST